MWIVFILIGVVLEILKANSILIIPIVAEYIVFGIGGFLFLVQIISWITAKKQISKMQKKFNRRF